MAAGNWRMIDPDPRFVEFWRLHNGEVPPPKCYAHPKGLTALVGHEPMGEYETDDKRWHISLRYGDPGIDGRVPTWDELASAAHELRPGVVFCIGVPPRSWWINVHEHVLHLWELRDENLIERWRQERLAMEPT
jgi:hypothetical protein